ncbi:MAG: hypothetical protein GF401_13770 [Chitinivibrionales bacterium]|nr:hypothetical protein [Chitinivibrionales bacterium]
MKQGDYFLQCCKSFLIISIGIGSLWADENSGEKVFSYRGIVEVTFQGASTLHDFEGNGISESFVLTGRHDSATGDTVIFAKITVYAESLATPNEGLNKNMYKTLESQQYPTITAIIDSVPLDNIRPGGEGDAGFSFVLRVRDVKNRLAATVSKFKMENEALIFTASFDFSISEFKLDPPAPAFGLIKMKDIVKVQARFVMSSGKE